MMVRLFVFPLSFLLCTLGGVEGLPEGVTVAGTSWTKEDIEKGVVEIVTGSFIVGVVEGKKASFLKIMKWDFDWEPTMPFSANLPMFAGVLNQAQLLWLLGRPEVQYIESDDDVRVESAGVKTRTDLEDRVGMSELPKGVSIQGKLVTTEDIESGEVEIATGSFIVGVLQGTKAALLEVMQRELAWEPALPYSASFPMFAGVLNNAQLLWLLRRAEVKYVESDGEAHILGSGNKMQARPESVDMSELPEGVSIEGKLVTKEEIMSGAVHVPTGSFIVGVVRGTKVSLLQMMKRDLAWEPVLPYSASLPLFAGVLNQAQLLWLLGRTEVEYIEQDGEAHIARADDKMQTARQESMDMNNGPAGVSIDGEIVTTEAIESGAVEIKTGDYVVGMSREGKPALLAEMKQKWGWEPRNIFSDTMPLFVGELNKEQILWLLRSAPQEVDFIENDGQDAVFFP